MFKIDVLLNLIMMKKQNTIAKIILIVAYIWGSAILAFVLFFLIAEFFGGEGSDWTSISTKDKITFIFFPLGTIIGLAIALRWKGLGGLVTTCSLVALFAIRVDLISNPTFPMLIFPPGLLYLIYWFISKGTNSSISTEDNISSY
jgi:hypothetical protein